MEIARPLQEIGPVHELERSLNQLEFALSYTTKPESWHPQMENISKCMSQVNHLSVSADQLKVWTKRVDRVMKELVHYGDSISQNNEHSVGLLSVVRTLEYLFLLRTKMVGSVVSHSLKV